MNCSICETSCIIPDGSVLYRSSANVAVVKEDGTIMCMACSEVSEWASSVTTVTKVKKDTSIKKPVKDQNKPQKIEKPVESTQSASSVYCSKCKDRFSTRVCKCGFKNPLFRK